MWALEGLTLFARNSGAFEEAAWAGTECQALAHTRGDLLVESTALGFLGYIALAQGAYEQADRLTKQALEMRARSEVGWNIAAAITDLGLAAYGRGDHQSARSYFDASHVAAGQGQAAELFDIALVHGFLAILDCEEGRYSQAAEHLVAALPIWQRLNNQENLAEWFAEVAVLATARGDHESGARFLGRATGLRDAVGHAFTLPERAAYDRAEQSLRAVLGAQAYEAEADMPSQDVLDDAAAYLEKVRATGTAIAPEHLLNRYGLTPREQDVLRLLTAGKADREIAEALFVGTRTVETHVSNLLAKLGVHNRTEAAARAMQTGLVDGRR
jgi:DNA-binding CsgD family transcriptional regulator